MLKILRTPPLMLALIATLTIIGAYGSTGFAQSSSQAKAAAEALFDEGVSLLKEADYAAACKKLEASEAVEPAVGTLLYLGECYARLGRTASAWATFREGASLATASGQFERAKQAKSRADAIEPGLSYVTIVVTKAVLSLPELRVLRGSETVSLAVLGTRVPLDPGKTTIEVSAKGYEPYKTVVEVNSGGSVVVEIPELTAVVPETQTSGTLEPPLTNSTNPLGGSTDLRTIHSDVVDPGKTQRILGWVMMGVGIGGVGIGTYFGVKAMSQNSKAESGSCDNNTCERKSDLDLVNSARDMATGANIAFAVGGAAIIGGVITYWLAPKAQTARYHISPQLAQNGFGLEIGGRL
jgi:serine/threonine-protein kinase